MSDKLVRINIRANAGKPKLEVRNGREVMVVPSATMPDNVVMNGILYPAEEIAKSFATLERSPAPYGHPIINGAYVSARDVEVMNIFGVGAWNANVRRENGRVFLDKIIDIQTARATEKGRALINVIDEGKPIHTSTGLLAHLEKAAEGLGYEFTARDIEFDHDAILANGEEGAATPEQGVGMLVNNEKIEVVNSSLVGDDLDWVSQNAARTMQEKSPEWRALVDRMKNAIVEAFSLSTTTNALRGSRKEAEMAEDNKQFEELSRKVDGLEGKISEQITNAATAAVDAAIKPLTDALASIKANQDAKDTAELTELTAKIVKANLMDEDAAKELTLNAARALAKKSELGVAAGMNVNGFNSGGGSDEFAGIDMNAAMEVN